MRENLLDKHLLCLVGTNPLPVYVACMSCKDEFSQGTLIHTDTPSIRENAANLKEELAKQGLSYCTATIARAEPDEIEATMRSLVKDYVQEGIKHLELNYTGGTKAMAVHCWSALREEAEKEGTSFTVSASYLDSKPHRIIRHQGNTTQTAIRDARRNCPISLDQLSRLHKCRLEPREMNREKFVALSYKLGQYYLRQNAGETEWDKAVYDEALQAEMDLWEHDSPKDKMMDKWLEGYTLKHLSEAFEELQALGFSCESHGSTRFYKGKAEKSAELDVVGIVGYQLIIFSCSTTKSEKDIKHKGFEAITRVRQLGGDESRAVVISLLNPTRADAVEKDLMQDIGSPGSPLEIWDVQRLPEDRFKEHLSRYLRRLSRI